jgi:SidE phosphodiesterase (PDE) domain
MTTVGQVGTSSLYVQYQQCKTDYKHLKLDQKIATIFFAIIAWFKGGTNGFYQTYITRVRTYYPIKPAPAAAVAPNTTAPTAPNATPIVIQGNPRQRHQGVINISIAQVGHLAPTDAKLGEIFRLANKVTVNQPYPCDANQRIGSDIFRPNHNGIHSARQARYVEALFDFITPRSGRGQSVINSLTPEEKINLKIAAYFLRAGRVDESNHKGGNPDDYYTRSALIYEAYAQQLNVTPSVIAWVKKLIINSCKPRGTRESDIDSNVKNRVGYEILTVAHIMDLVRCFDKNTFDSHDVPSLRARLNYLVQNGGNNVDQFVKYAKDLCRLTGDRLASEGNYRYDLSKFRPCSLDGAHCWSQVQSCALPQWK